MRYLFLLLVTVFLVACASKRVPIAERPNSLAKELWLPSASIHLYPDTTYFRTEGQAWQVRQMRDSSAFFFLHSDSSLVVVAGTPLWNIFEVRRATVGAVVIWGSYPFTIPVAVPFRVVCVKEPYIEVKAYRY